MRKFKFINKKTKEEHICSRIVFHGYYFYVTDEEIKKGDWFFNYYASGEPISIRECTAVVGDKVYDSSTIVHENGDGIKKIFATNHPHFENIKFLDNDEHVSLRIFPIREQVISGELYHHDVDGERREGFMMGQYESQKKYSFSEEDMVGFMKFCMGDMPYSTDDGVLDEAFKKLLGQWLEENMVTIYYK